MATERIYIEEIEHNISSEAKGAENGNRTKMFGF